jgi:hypothetical protein
MNVLDLRGLPPASRTWDVRSRGRASATEEEPLMKRLEPSRWSRRVIIEP